MGGFLGPINLKSAQILKNKILLQEVKDYLNQNLKEETCGIIFKEGEKSVFLPIINLSETPSSSFVFNPRVLIEYNVEYIVHSHICGTATPSENDMACSNELAIDYLIYSTTYDEFFLYENVSV